MMDGKIMLARTLDLLCTSEEPFRVPKEHGPEKRPAVGRQVRVMPKQLG